MLKKIALSVCMGLMPMIFFAQNTTENLKTLSQEDYAGWKTVSGSQISHHGDFVIFEVNPLREDGVLHVTNLQDMSEVEIPRGDKAGFSPQNGYVVFHIVPQKAVERQAKVDKKKKDEMPKDSLGILIPGQELPVKYPNVLSYQLPKKESDWMAFLAEVTLEKPDTTDNAPDNAADSIPEHASEDTLQVEKEPAKEKIKKLYIKDPVSAKEHVFEHVEKYEMAENGKTVLFLQEVKEEEDSLDVKKLYFFDTGKERAVLLDSLEGDFKQLSVSKNGELMAWLFSADTTDVKTYDLFMHKTGRRGETLSFTMETENMPEGYAVSEYEKPSFSDDHQRMFLGIAPRPEQEEEDTLLDEEKYKLDIWHWQDPLIQPHQKERIKREKEKHYLAVYDIKEEKFVPLGTEQIPNISKDRHGNADVMMGTNDLPYRREISWMGRSARDVYAVSLADGSAKLVKEKAEANVHFSVNGKYILYYDTETRSWMSYSVENEETVDLTSQTGIPFYNELNDIPADPRPYGIAGWGEDDRFVLIYDRYDIWKFDPEDEEPPLNITGNYGRENTIRLRYQNLDPDVYFIPDKEIFLSGFHEKNKKSGYFSLDMRNGEISSLVWEEASYTQLKKAKEDDQFLWRKGTFTVYPDLWTSTTTFSNRQRLSDANPQQDEYRWGTNELVEWVSFNNDTLQGIMYYPENLDKSEKHPMIVYFYERSSDGLYRHRIPSPSRSIINPSYCVSNGYIVFVPDIVYTTGFPGQNAYDAIVSGTQSMLERYDFIDREKLALQGQSWGGYQIAYLVTQTNMFAAAMAGAPVSNMVSAYGGIRWGSGMSRQFQYEKTQSRLGGTLWEKPFRYIENSPVFFADKVQTPLLMMHNDADGAVPWYQGIEMFMALRRLDKPVWMLVYNNEEHNLTRWPNRMDLDKRMYQFFDYYLKDAPAPAWIEEGRSFIDKEKTDAY